MPKTYTEADMNLGLWDLKSSNNLSIKQTAANFNVPQLTL
jgi:hypothetical protein